ncbi:hypothetical protein ACFXKG_23600 [Streptomyces sp. NPDC059255]
MTSTRWQKTAPVADGFDAYDGMARPSPCPAWAPTRAGRLGAHGGVPTS